MRGHADPKASLQLRPFLISHHSPSSTRSAGSRPGPTSLTTTKAPRLVLEPQPPNRLGLRWPEMPCALSRRTHRAHSSWVVWPHKPTPRPAQATPPATPHKHHYIILSLSAARLRGQACHSWPLPCSDIPTATPSSTPNSPSCTRRIFCWGAQTNRCNMPGGRRSWPHSHARLGPAALILPIWGGPPCA